MQSGLDKLHECLRRAGLTGRLMEDIAVVVDRGEGRIIMYSHLRDNMAQYRTKKEKCGRKKKDLC